MIEYYIFFKEHPVTPPEKVGTIFMVTRYAVIAEMARNMDTFEVTAVSSR